MQPSNTSTLSLAGHLRSLADPDLVSLLTARGVRDVGITDFFDLADVLLDGASIQKALVRLDRPTLAAIAVVGSAVAGATDHSGDSDVAGLTTAEVADRLAALGTSVSDVGDSLAKAAALALVHGADGRWLPYQPVVAQQLTWPALDLPDPEQLATEPAPAALAPVSAADTRFIDSIAAEHAFGTTTSIAELIAEVRRDPARELARGGIALPDAKRLAAAMAVDLDDVPSLVAIAARGDLVGLDGGSWLPAAGSATWLLGATADRWTHLAQAWFDRLPPDIRHLLASRAHSMWGTRLAEYLRWLYPAGGDWMRERSLVVTREAELLGITARQVPSTPGSALIGAGPAAATTAMSVLFPPEVDRVYVQQDLSIVSPGPLEPRLDARLRGMADVESRTLAATYRVTTSSINRALASGETAETLRAFLTEISITGIPQPLSYLIAGTAARYGLIRVGTVDGTSTAAADVAATAATAGATQSEGSHSARVVRDEREALSYIRTDDAGLLGSLLVDQSVSTLGIRRVGPFRAVSRFRRDLVFWALNEARYPVAAEDADGQIIVLERRRIATSASPAVEPAAVGIVRRLREGGEPTSSETGKAWLERQLEAAIKGRFPLTVTVKMPNGSLVELQLEPAGLSGGRLRARDRRSDLERTLPLSSIMSVEPTEAP